MDTTLVLGSVAIVGAAGALVWSFAGSRKAGAAIELGSYAISRPDLESVARRRDENDDSRSQLLGNLGRRITPAGRIAVIEQRLLSAGTPDGWTVQRVLTIKGAALAATLVLAMLRMIGGFSVGALISTLAIGALAYFVPDVRISSMIKDREDEVRRSLAQTVDQITVMVQAGLALDAAIARTARTSNGPLSGELTRVSHDIRAGIPREQALLAMAERIQLAELRQFVNAVAQSERLGVSISHTLQLQASELREKRRQQAEEQAMKLPVKVLFPTMFCILPCLFVVVLGPAVIRLMDSFN